MTSNFASEDLSKKNTIGIVDGRTTPYGFNILLNNPISRTAYLTGIHENRNYTLAVQSVWNDKKGFFASVRVVGDIPKTPFDLSTPIYIASDEQIQKALNMNIPHEKALNLGEILSTIIKATPNVEKLGRVFITGKSGSGKSYTVGVLIEELLKKQIPVVIIDRHGEYSSLKVLQKENISWDDPYFQKPENQLGFASSVVEFGDQTINPGVDLGLEYCLANIPSDIVCTGQCTIVNLRGLDIPTQENVTDQILSTLYKASTTRVIPPFFLFVDEAHLFAGKKTKSVLDTLRLFAQEGRKFGANLVVITQKPQALDTTIRAQAGTWIIHKLTDVNDVKITINSSEGLSADMDQEIQNLAPGEAIIVGDLTPLTPLRVKIRKRYTMHGGSGYNILDFVKLGQIKKSTIVNRLQNRISQENINQIRSQIGLNSDNVNENLNQTNKTDKNLELESLKSQILEQTNRLATIQKEKQDLQKENSSLNDSLKTTLKDSEKWKEKFNTEHKRAEESIKVAEKALFQLKGGKK
jgi:DNA helicase HerA-like ATPase